MYANEKYSASVIFNAANSSASEESAESTASGHANAALYFGRGPDGNNQDIWTVPITRDGERSALLCPSPSSTRRQAMQPRRCALMEGRSCSSHSVKAGSPRLRTWDHW